MAKVKSNDVKRVLEVYGVDSTVVPLPPRAKLNRLEKNALEKVGEAREIKVSSVQSYKLAAEFAKTCHEFESAVHELLDEHIANAHKSHKALTETRAKLLKPFVEAREIVTSRMSQYDFQQRQLAQAKADTEAAKERAKEIKAANKAGDTELVEELEKEPLEVLQVGKVAPAIAGVVSKPVVTFEITDYQVIPRKFLKVDEQAIKAYLKVHGVEAIIAGVRVFEEVKTIIR